MLPFTQELEELIKGGDGSDELKEKLAQKELGKILKSILESIAEPEQSQVR